MEGCDRKIGLFDCCTIVIGNCLDIMAQTPQNYVDLIVTSPPYYNAKEYSQWKTYNDYLVSMAEVWPLCFDILKPGGRIAVNVAAGYNRAPWLPLSVRG